MITLTYQNNTLTADTSELVCGNDIYVTVFADKNCSIVAEKGEAIFVFSSEEENIILPYDFSENEGYIKFTAYEAPEEARAEAYVYIRQSITSVKTSEGIKAEGTEDIPDENSVIHISLVGKELSFASGTQKVKIVEDNEDYFLKFSLDIFFAILYCRIIKDGKYIDTPLSAEGYVKIPRCILKSGHIIIGLYNHSFATIPLHIHVCGSILSELNVEPLSTESADEDIVLNDTSDLEEDGGSTPEEDTLFISLLNKELSFVSGTQKIKIVEDNEDYFIKFFLDDDFDVLYCRIIKDGKYIDKRLSAEGLVRIPKYMLKEGHIIVGLFNLSFATLPLHIHICGSILGSFDVEPGVEPVPDNVDYNTVKNKPTINGVPVEGDKTSEDYGLSFSVSDEISEHNTDKASHNDIRLLIEGLAARLNVILDSDDITLDQMSEVAAYIKSNRTLIDSITTSKVSKSDIVNNLSTAVPDKPLSAEMGAALKALIDAMTIPTKVSELENDEGYLKEHQSLEDYAKKEELPTVPTKVSAFENDKGYLTEHQSLENYYTKAETTERLNQKQDTLDKYVESVNGYSEEVNLSASDVHALPDTTVIPTVPSVVSAFVNDADYADRKYVAEVAAGKCNAYTFGTVAELDEWLSVDENTTNLNNGDVFYIREVGVPDYWWDKDTQSKQILETTKVDLTDYAKKDSIPQKVSQLTNDAGYTTASEVDTKLGEKQDKLTEYASSVNGKSGNVVLNSSDVGALPADTFIPSKMSELNDDKGYALKSEIPTIPSSLPANGGNADTVGGYGLRIVTDINDPGMDGFLTVII